MRIVGVDLGTRKIAWSVWEDGVLTSTHEKQSEHPKRQDQLFKISERFCVEMQMLDPDVIFIEDVLIGNNRKYSLQLAEMKGAVLSRLYGWDVYMANVSTWKKHTIGNGRADKEMIREYLYSVDSAYIDLCGQSQDRFDAACIGYYGVLIERKAGNLETPRGALGSD